MKNVSNNFYNLYFRLLLKIILLKNNQQDSNIFELLKRIHGKKKKGSNWQETSGNNMAVAPGNKGAQHGRTVTSEGRNRHYPMFATKHALPARKETCNPSTRKLSPLCANYKFVNWQEDPPRVVPDVCFRGGKNDDDAYNRSLLIRERDR